MKEEQNEAVKKAIELFRDYSFTNNSETIDEFLDKLFLQHLTHQASVIRTLIEIIKRYENARFVDGRNEGAVRASKLINKLDQDEGLGISYI